MATINRRCPIPLGDIPTVLVSGGVVALFEYLAYLLLKARGMNSVGIICTMILLFIAIPGFILLYLTFRDARASVRVGRRVLAGAPPAPPAPVAPGPAVPPPAYLEALQIMVAHQEAARGTPGPHAL